MTDPADIDCVLKEAEIYQQSDVRRATGIVSADRKGRFSDGERVHTSAIVWGPDEDGVIKTRNSVYRLEMASA